MSPGRKLDGEGVIQSDLLEDPPEVLVEFAVGCSLQLHCVLLKGEKE